VKGHAIVLVSAAAPGTDHTYTYAQVLGQKYNSSALPSLVPTSVAKSSASEVNRPMSDSRRVPKSETNRWGFRNS
jgi:hypothetical protein